MDYLKANYDRCLSLAAGIFLAAASIYGILGIADLANRFPAPTALAGGASHEPNESVSRISAEVAKLTEPSSSTWDEDERLLFVSRVYLLSGGKLIDIVDSDVQLSPGIPNSWILQHRLEYTDPRLAAQDPDEDGFNNLEEFNAGTLPRDPSSKPPAWIKLRVKAFEKIPFRIKFMGAPSLRPGEPFDQSTEFSINTLDYSSPTQFLRLGEDVAGTALQITKAESKTAMNSVGSTVDVSELTLKDKNTGDEIVLITDKEVDSPYSYALLVNALTGEETRVEKGKSFTVGPGGPTYKLIDVTAEGAIISPTEADGDRLKVPPLQTTETAAPQPNP